MSATSTAERITLTEQAEDRAAQGRTDRGARASARATRHTDRRGARSRRPASRAAARPAPRPTAASTVVRRTSVRRQASRAAASPRVHLTRRGRLLVLVLLAGVVLAAFSFGRSASQASTVGSSGAPSAPSLEQVTVQSGESLWTVARRIAPDHDPRDVVAQIRRINDLTDPRLQPGQQLLLPVAA